MLHFVSVIPSQVICWEEHCEITSFCVKWMLKPILISQEPRINATVWVCYCCCCMLQAVRTFFWTNRATCREWLTRVRLQLMLIAQHQHDWATVVRHGYLLLAELAESTSTPVLVWFFHDSNMNIVDSVYHFVLLLFLAHLISINHLTFSHRYFRLQKENLLG